MVFFKVISYTLVMTEEAINRRTIKGKRIISVRTHSGLFGFKYESETESFYSLVYALRPDGNRDF